MAKLKAFEAGSLQQVTETATAWLELNRENISIISTSHSSFNKRDIHDDKNFSVMVSYYPAIGRKVLDLPNPNIARIHGDFDARENEDIMC